MPLDAHFEKLRDALIQRFLGKSFAPRPPLDTSRYPLSKRSISLLETNSSSERWSRVSFWGLKLFGHTHIKKKRARKKVTKRLQAHNDRTVAFLFLSICMVAPIRRRLDYSSIGRKVLLVEPLPDGALPALSPPPLEAKWDMG